MILLSGQAKQTTFGDQNDLTGAAFGHGISGGGSVFGMVSPHTSAQASRRMSCDRNIANGEDDGVGCSSHPSTSAPCEGAKGDGDAVHRWGGAAERPSELLFMAQARLSEGNTVGESRAGSYNTVPLRVRTGRRKALEEATAGLIYRGVLVCGVASCLWAGSLMILYGMKGVGATMLSLIPTAYPVSCAAAWILCSFFGKSSSSTSWVILIVHQLALLSLPALVQINMGGMERSGCVVLWALVAPFSALVMNEGRQARLGFACFVIEITILVSLEHASVGLEPLAFIDTKELPVTDVQHTAFLYRQHRRLATLRGTRQPQQSLAE